MVDAVAAEHYLDRCAPKIDFNRCPPPDYDARKRFAYMSSSTSPGMDGPPNVAWPAREKCTEALWQVMTGMPSGGPLPDEANATVQAFFPRGEEPDDAEHIGCRRDPSKVRVLGLRNTSLEIISSAMSAAMAAVAAGVVPASQPGIIHRRSCGYNILELDVESRAASADANAMTNLPVLRSLDVAQAIPSFARHFVRPALTVMGAPEAALNFFDLVCCNILAMGSGWSGALYAMGTSCFLLGLGQKLEHRGCGPCRACADDLGLVLAAVIHLARLEGVMVLVEDLAGLVPKLAKCHIVPLAGPVDDELVNKLRAALAV
ncbi:unnamed protein product, partial [Prorocentrum cordatum]